MASAYPLFIAKVSRETPNCVASPDVAVFRLPIAKLVALRVPPNAGLVSKTSLDPRFFNVILFGSVSMISIPSPSSVLARILLPLGSTMKVELATNCPFLVGS